MFTMDSDSFNASLENSDSFQPPLEKSVSSNAPLVNPPQQTIKVLETSGISKAGEQDVSSKVWVGIEKTTDKYNDDIDKISQRCNEDINIIMLFAGLFSAVDTAFLIAMQSNPADTTNDLLVQLLQNTLNTSSVAQPVAFSPTATYSSSSLWMQVLAYASLTFNLLAAFGAVFGKQQLEQYKAHRFDGRQFGDEFQQSAELKGRGFEQFLKSLLVPLTCCLLSPWQPPRGGNTGPSPFSSSYQLLAASSSITTSSWYPVTVHSRRRSP
ncbi:hypothetical protein F4604DRAFT_758585 [Suillus subluteus]|nr:hypothetical protein F4604DRAFT_758585 [Suillus subluteus]